MIRRAVELEVGDVFGKRQLGNGELVLHRPGVLLVDLRVEQVGNDVLGFVLALDRSRHDLVEGCLHAVELEFAHELEDLGSFHQMALRRFENDIGEMDAMTEGFGTGGFPQRADWQSAPR